MDTGLKEAWVEFLSRWRWDAFLTITYREPRQPHHAQASLNAIAKVIRRHTHRRVFLGGELHISRALHVHGLLQFPGHDPSFYRAAGSALWSELFERFGRSQVSPVQAQEAVSTYVTKYSVKDLTEWLML